MKNKQLIALVVGVALVTALIVSIATVSLTGNVIVRQGWRSSTVEVATKTEVLNMLNRCEVKYNEDPNMPISCNDLCGRSKCIFAEKLKVYNIQGIELAQESTPACENVVAVGGSPKIILKCTCCSP